MSVSKLLYIANKYSPAGLWARTVYPLLGAVCSMKLSSRARSAGHAGAAPALRWSHGQPGHYAGR